MHRAISSTNFDHFQPVSKWFEKFDTTPSSTPFHSPFFSPRRDKLEARVSTLFPCTAVCLALCMKQRQHFIRLGCKSYRARVYQRGVFAPATANSWNDSSDPANPYPRGRFEFLEILSSVSNYRDKCSRWNQHRNISLSDEPPVLENLSPPSSFFSSAFHQLSNATFFYFSLYQCCTSESGLEGLVNSRSEGLNGF